MNTIINNKKWSILVYTLLIGMVLSSLAVYFFWNTTKTENIILVWNQNILATPQSSYEDAMLRVSKIDSSETSSSYETSQENYENDPFKEVNSSDIAHSSTLVDEWILNNLTTDLEWNIDNKLTKQTWLDRIITSKFKKFMVLDTEQAPNQGKFVYEFSLDNSTPIDYLNFYWGSNGKSSDAYIIMSRFSKNDLKWFNLNQTDPEIKDMINKNYGRGTSVYNSGDNDNLMNRNYVLLKQIDNIYNSEDADIPIVYPDGSKFRWQNKRTIEDLITALDLDTNNYFYKFYIVFPFNSANTETIPFKIEAYQGGNLVAMWLSNLMRIDTTGLYRGVKSRIEITKSVDNNIIPYFIYWVYSNQELKR